jgi:YVTN family beta-propeller protein
VIRATDHRRPYVTVGRTNEVVVIDTQSNQVTTRIKAGELPWGVAIADAK